VGRGKGRRRQLTTSDAAIEQRALLRFNGVGKTPAMMGGIILEVVSLFAYKNSQLLGKNG
jgi:hypothetical protein